MLDVTIDTTPLPLVGPQVGDAVAVQGDVLAELARSAAGLPPTWLMLPAGTEGTILGYRERGGESYAIVELEVDRKMIMFVREEKLVRVLPKAAPPPMSRRRPTRHRRY